jgi:hypothetical protein
MDLVCMCLLVSCSQQWNLVEFLPRALHQPMQLLLAEWMYLPWQEANKAAAAARGASQGGSQAALDTRQAEQIQVKGQPAWRTMHQATSKAPKDLCTLRSWMRLARATCWLGL